jgi:hypothetical protein
MRSSVTSGLLSAWRTASLSLALLPRTRALVSKSAAMRVGFFQEYLPTLRGMGRHTIQSYRDGPVLFLQFAATDCGRAIESLGVADITADRVSRFRAFLDTARPGRIGISCGLGPRPCFPEGRLS